MLRKHLAHITNNLTVGNTYVFSTPSSENKGQSQPRHSVSVHLLGAKQTYLLPLEFSGESNTSLPCLLYYRGHILSLPHGPSEASVTRISIEFKIKLSKIPIYKIFLSQSPNLLYNICV